VAIERIKANATHRKMSVTFPEWRVAGDFEISDVITDQLLHRRNEGYFAPLLVVDAE
jgi:hypothetical protein